MIHPQRQAAKQAEDQAQDAKSPALVWYFTSAKIGLLLKSKAVLPVHADRVR
jgi:hypothetical protein